MSKSQDLLNSIKKLEENTEVNERFFRHTYARATASRHTNVPAGSPLSFTPANSDEEKTFGTGSMVHHSVINGAVTHTHVIKRSPKSPTAFEHHVYNYHKTGNNAGQIKSHKVMSFRTQAEAYMSANKSPMNRFVKRTANTVVDSAKTGTKNLVTKHAPNYAGHILKGLAKSVLNV